MDTAPKIFVLGHVNGQLEAAFKKLATLHAKNNFSCAIATGNLFAAGDEATDATNEQLTKLLDGQITIPVSTYFTVGTRSLPPQIASKIEAEDFDGDICENLHYLGKRSVTKTSDGIRIVALGGLLDESIVEAGPSKDQFLPFHSIEDEKSLRGAHSADILLTAIWPKGVTKGSKVALPEGVNVDQIPSSQGISDLVAALRPRYHLTASPENVSENQTAAPAFFYEREGFFHPERPDKTHSLAIDVTRFISLAAYGNPAKAKAMYAFALAAEAPTLVPAGCTASPFLGNAKKRPALDLDPYPGRFGHYSEGGRHGGKRARQRAPPPGPDQCYFCLSNPNLPTHMVCSIGNDAYLATAKGPLPTPTTFAKQGLNFPGHMIIVPLSHTPTLQSGGDDAAAAVAEMTRFRSSLQAMVAARSKQQLGTVTWEISRERNVHLHWQVVPVAGDMVKRGLVEAAFRVEAENMKLPKLETETGDSSAAPSGDYFRLWIYSEDDSSVHSKTLVMKLDPNERFDLQYGRKVLAKLMGLEVQRTIWQDCVQTEAEETADVAAFRAAFAEWDFTLTE